jgi:hypothetical protein
LVATMTLRTARACVTTSTWSTWHMCGQADAHLAGGGLACGGPLHSTARLGCRAMWLR